VARKSHLSEFFFLVGCRTHWLIAIVARFWEARFPLQEISTAEFLKHSPEESKLVVASVHTFSVLTG
jgi:hypothetical protein